MNTRPDENDFPGWRILSVSTWGGPLVTPYVAGEIFSTRMQFSIQEQLLRRIVKQFWGGLVFEAYRLAYLSTLGWILIKKKKRYLALGLEFEPTLHCRRLLRSMPLQPTFRFKVLRLGILNYMYLSIYIYIYIYVYTHTDTHIYTHTHIYIYVYIYVYIYMYVFEFYI